MHDVSLTTYDWGMLLGALAFRAAWPAPGSDLGIEPYRTLARTLGGEEIFDEMFAAAVQDRKYWLTLPVDAAVAMHEEAGGGFSFSSGDHCRECLRRALLEDLALFLRRESEGVRSR